MTSYLSGILTSTSSRYASLRQTLLPESAEKDGDTEDDSQICRVLRAYYVEKGRPFPQWLPPDPKQRRPEPAPQPSGYFSNAFGQQSQGNSHLNTPASAPGGVYRPAASAPRRSGGLNDLWDGPGQQQQQQPPPNQSLRMGRQTSNQALFTTAVHHANYGAGSPGQAAAFTTHQTTYGQGPAPGRGERYDSGGQQSARLTPAGSRPQPGSRQGSYQSSAGGRQPSGEYVPGGGYDQNTSAAGGQTAQDRLKARLWGSSTSGRRGG